MATKNKKIVKVHLYSDTFNRLVNRPRQGTLACALLNLKSGDALRITNGNSFNLCGNLTFVAKRYLGSKSGYSKHFVMRTTDDGTLFAIRR